MKYRRLGKTKMEVSVVGVGTWQLGGEWGHDFTQAEADAILGAAGDAGINLVDTAECYGDHLSEQLVGNAIHRDREKWIVATKFGHKYHGYLKRTPLWSAADVIKQLEDSLVALRTDYIDLYQCHSANDQMFDDAERWEALQKAVRAGKIRHVGNSISPNDKPYQIERSELYGIEAIQIIYNRIRRQPEERIFPFCQQHDLGVLARVPLASGYLSGKYKPGARFPANDVRSNANVEAEDQKLREVEEIRRREVPAGVDMAQWALAWCLRHPAVASVIPGCKNAGQVRSNAAAMALVAESHPLQM